MQHPASPAVARPSCQTLGRLQCSKNLSRSSRAVRPAPGEPVVVRNWPTSNICPGCPSRRRAAIAGFVQPRKKGSRSPRLKQNACRHFLRAHACPAEPRPPIPVRLATNEFKPIQMYMRCQPNLNHESLPARRAMLVASITPHRSHSARRRSSQSAKLRLFRPALPHAQANSGALCEPAP